jgi:hypothetical protein
MKLEILDPIEEQLDIIVVLCDGKLLYFCDFGIHVDFEVGTNACKNLGKERQAVHLFFMSILTDPRVKIAVLFDCLMG